MRVLGNFVAVNPAKQLSQTESGIYVAPSSYSDGAEGIVRAIGSGIKDGVEYRKGDRVFIEMYKAQKHVYDIENDVFIFLHKFDICGVDANGRFHPIRDHVMLKPIPRPQSLIVRPDNYEEDEGVITYHEVFLCGSGQRTKKAGVVPFDIKPGDKVMTVANIGRDVMAADGTYKLVMYQHILAKIT